MYSDSGCVTVCLAGSVDDARHGRCDGRRRSRVVRGGGAGALITDRGWGAPAVLADEGAVLVELDVHAVAILSQRVVAGSLAVATKRRLAF